MTRKYYNGDLSLLEGYLNEPTVQNAVLEHIRGLNRPFLLRDVYRPMGLPRYTANRVLDRLLKAGVVTATPVNVDYNFKDRNGVIQTPGIRRTMKLYRLAEPSE